MSNFRIISNFGIFADRPTPNEYQAGSRYVSTDTAQEFIWDGSAWIEIAYGALNNSATTAPGVSNDNTEGYSPGSRWVDTATDTVYFNTDASTGAAVWKDVSTAGGGGGATVIGPDTAPASPDALNEEFDSSTLTAWSAVAGAGTPQNAALPANWQEGLATDPYYNADTDVPGRLVLANRNSSWLRLSKPFAIAASTRWCLYAKLKMTRNYNNSEAVYIGLSKNNPSGIATLTTAAASEDMMYISINRSSNAMQIAGAANTNNAVVTGTNYTANLFVNECYITIEGDASNNMKVYFSTSGPYSLRVNDLNAAGAGIRGNINYLWVAANASFPAAAEIDFIRVLVGDGDANKLAYGN